MTTGLTASLLKHWNWSWQNEVIDASVVSPELIEEGVPRVDEKRYRDNRTEFGNLA